jgi:uncharacterized membrane protein
MLTLSQTLVDRHREEIAVLASSILFLMGASAIVWLAGF